MSSPRVGLEWRRIEQGMAFALVLLKLNVLFHAWGKPQGFDWSPWLDVFRMTHWFEPLPPIRSLFNSYHPPLSYLIGRWVFAVYPREVEASQITSTLSVLAGFWVLRGALKYTRMLWTPAGLWLVYGSVSVPLIVWLGIETSYDPMVLGWYLVALGSSLRVFWNPLGPRWWEDWRTTGHVTLLGLALSAGLLTKFNALFALGFPPLVVWARRGFWGLRHEAGALLAALAVVALVVGPFYYERFYRAEGVFFPQPMEWWRKEDLERVWAERDAAPLRFLMRMLRWPEAPLVGTQEPVLNSAVHSLWLHVWKRDTWLGVQAPLSSAVSDVYVRLFAALCSGGALWLIVRWRRLDKSFRDVVVVIAGVSLVLFAASLYFAYKYPIWDWRVFKGKYISPVALALVCCVAAPLGDQAMRSGQPLSSARLAAASVWALMLFMFVNHLLPVY